MQFLEVAVDQAPAPSAEDGPVETYTCLIGTDSLDLKVQIQPG